MVGTAPGTPEAPLLAITRRVSPLPVRIDIDHILDGLRYSDRTQKGDSFRSGPPKNYSQVLVTNPLELVSPRADQLRCLAFKERDLLDSLRGKT